MKDSRGAPPASRLGPAVLPLAIAAAAFVAFLPSFWGQFLDFDDKANLVDNTAFRGLGLGQLRWMFTAYHMGLYIPATWLTFGADYLLWGLDPRGFHLTNLLLHAANAALVYVVALRLYRRAAAGAEGTPWSWGAGLAALLFALHPLRVESVAWITERRDVLSACLLLLATLAYLEHAEREPRASGSMGPWYWLSLGAYGVSLLAKAMAMTFPAVLLLLDLYPLRRGLRWREKLPFAALAFFAAANTYWGLRGAEKTAVLGSYDALQSAAFCLYGAAFYLWKSLLPFGLSPLYEAPLRLDPWQPAYLASAALVAGLTGLAWAWRGRRPAFSAAWAYYLIAISPVVGVVRNGPQIVADRYSYLPCLSWAILAGAAAALWLRDRGEAGRRLALAAAACLAVVLGSATWRQCAVWRSSADLWTRVLSLNPGSHTAHNNLANHLWAKGKTDEAEEHYRQALEAQPLYAPSLTNLGGMLLMKGRRTEAMDFLRRSLRLKPGQPEARNNLGVALLGQGRPMEAALEFAEALRIRPGWKPAQDNLRAALLTANARGRVSARVNLR
ncbi:MAG: tetratricopeptide repeat protein [Elusimicrobia bacterium]|nr:tetratricopeptide repeat protein [Elusimicrobiota bacterium]